MQANGTEWFRTESAVERLIAWIDNNINMVAFDLAKAFTKQGSNVVASASVDAFIEDQNVGKVDHLFLDYDLGGQDGFEQIERILEKKEIDKVYVCTAFAHLEQIGEKRDQIQKRTGKKIGLIRKENLPFVDEHDEIAEFMTELDKGDYLDDTADLSLSELREHETIPTFEQYKRLSLTERIRVLELGRKLYASTIDSHFSDGFIWLFIDANTGSVLQSSREAENILPQMEIDVYAEQNRIVPLTFSKGWSIDALDNVCNPMSEMANYPVIQLDKSATEDEFPEFLHYDDGNSFSLFGYEYFLEKGWINVLFSPGMREQGDLTLIGKEVRFRGIELKDAFGQTKSRDFTGFAAMNWQKLRIALPCTEVCGRGMLYPPSNEKRLCTRRKALLGRNLKEELETGITTFPKTSKVRFESVLPD
jgi:CheY-like chemotaxis protein